MNIESNIINKERRKLEIIGLYEIIGGAVGIGLILWGMISISNFSIMAILLYLIVIFLYSFSIYAGVKLFKYKENKIIYSEIIQYLQIPKIGLLGFIFTFTAGISFFLGIDYTNDFLFRFDFNLSPSNTSLYFKTDKSLIFFYINFVPILIIYLIGKSTTKIEKEKELINEPR